MKKEEYIVNQNILRRYGYTISLLWVAGSSFFILWSLLLSGKRDLSGTSPLFKVCSLAYIFGGATIVIWLKIRRQKKLGAICPKCGKLFLANAISARHTKNTGKCIRCGEVIIEEFKTQP